MKEFVEYMVKALVDDPSQVTVTEVDAGSEIILELRVAQGDMGRVIGRSGKVINALRALAQVAGVRQAKRVQLELVED